MTRRARLLRQCLNLRWVLLIEFGQDDSSVEKQLVCLPTRHTTKSNCSCRICQCLQKLSLWRRKNASPELLDYLDQVMRLLLLLRVRDASGAQEIDESLSHLPDPRTDHRAQASPKIRELLAALEVAP